jgi:hypothetical protein
MMRCEWHSYGKPQQLREKRVGDRVTSNGNNYHCEGDERIGGNNREDFGAVDHPILPDFDRITKEENG